MDFHTFITLRDACKRSGIPDDPEDFYKMVFADGFDIELVNRVVGKMRGLSRYNK